MKERWKVWNSYNYNTPEYFDTEEEAIEHFEKVTANNWVSMANITHEVVIRTHTKVNPVKVNPQ